MAQRWQILIFHFLLLFAVCMNGSFCWKKKAKQTLQSRETNPFNFIRLFAMRLIYGLASVMGFNEGISNVLGGVFVPPGVEDDYGDYEDYDF